MNEQVTVNPPRLRKRQARFTGPQAEAAGLTRAHRAFHKPQRDHAAPVQHPKPEGQHD